ncbi:MAG: hypothetical protein WCH11_01890 [Bdellovibrio sp.]
MWWLGMVGVSIVNLAFWSWTFVFTLPKLPRSPAKRSLLDPRNMIWLSGIYVSVCAFRSLLPRADVQRICLFDTWFSSVFIGRTLATFAELAFVAQWSIVFSFLSREMSLGFVGGISRGILWIIALAELCSWYAVITTHYLGNVIEESLWAFTYFLIFIALVQVFFRLRGALRLAVFFAILGVGLYVSFMIWVDVPMYIQRLYEDQQSGKLYFGFVEGIIDLNTRWVVTHDIRDWREEIPWQSLYFSLAVLVSIALCYVPLFPSRIAKHLR